MNRFYIEPAASHESVIVLSERESHHAANVLRMKAGEQVVALNGQGAELLCKVDKVARRQVTLKLIKRKEITPRPYQISLVQAVPKGKTMETIIEKGVELGVANIVPVLAERTVVHFDRQGAEAKLEKWNWIAIDAIKQCGSPWLPTIHSPKSIPEYVAAPIYGELTFVGSLQSDAQHPRAYFSDFAAKNRRKPKSVLVWIGPEGDFAPAELKLIQESGAQPITLGQLVLRCDTAAFYCLSVLNYELQAPT
jgi:16S rRNA (uracil1498-N3)-methyltransferase